MFSKMLLQSSLALLFFSQTLPAQTSKRPLRPGDIYRLQSTNDAHVSPDGKWIVYTLSTVDSSKDKRNSDIWMMSWAGTQSIQLTFDKGGESNPRFSPDGKYISFIASREEGSSQVYLLNLKGGEGNKLTDVKGDLEQYQWSPDGKRLLLTIKDYEDTAGKKKPQPYVIDRYQFKRDITGYRYSKLKTHLYLFDLATKKLDTLTSGNYDEGDAEWSPDGTQIAFVSNHTADPDKNDNSDIFIMPATTRAAAKQITTWTGSDENPQWSPDGKTLAYLRSTSNQNYIMYDQSVLCTIPVIGGEPRTMSLSLDRPVNSAKWNTDGSEIMVIVTDDCKRYVSSYNIKDGKISTVIAGDRSFTSLERNPIGGWLTSMTSPQLPNELYAIENGTLRRLTTIQNKFVDSLALATVEKFVSKTKDGTEVTSLLFLPPNIEPKKLPVIYFIHGGPVGQDEFGFDLSRQMLSAAGYAVVAVNYRGSNGRGIAFSKAIYADWGNKEVKDILGSADYLINKGTIDPARMGIGGWSYGGILTDYTIASDTRFKAAASGAGSALQLSLYGVDQYVLQLDNELGQPWKNNNYEKYLKLSYPFLHADRIKTPTLFMAGEKDFNVPSLGSEQLYQAFKSLGLDAELIIYPGQFHGLTIPSFQKDRFDRYLAWFGKYLK